MIVLALVAKGWRNAQIADELLIRPKTVETHLYHIYDKLGISSRTEAALYVLRPELLSHADMSGNSDDSKADKTYSRT
jgi:DNA-binding NarL/FixJ family response regulator